MTRLSGMLLVIPNLPWLGCCWMYQVGGGFARGVVTLNPGVVIPWGASLLLVSILRGWTVAQNPVTCPWSVPPLQCPGCLFPCWDCPVSSSWEPLLNTGLSQLVFVLFSV